MRGVPLFMKNTRAQTNLARGGKKQSGGFTLIASLLMLLLLSGIAIGLLMMANTESKVGGTDLQNNIAYHAAEGGIEKMYSDLTAVFQNAQAPTTSEICAVSNTPPSMVGVNWSLYTVAPGSGCGSGAPTTPTAYWNTLSAGPEAGLYAQVIPVNMQATASMFGGQEVNMTRSAQVALIPVFQYGVFCEGDCAFFDNPNLNFVGRVHANGDLYIGVMSGYSIVFHDKLEAYGNVVTESLPNGLSISSGASNDTGNVYLPTVSGGCSSTLPLVNCVLKSPNSDPATNPYGDGSVTGKGSATAQSGSSYNGLPTSGNWNTFSNTTTSNMIINGNYWAQARLRLRGLEPRNCRCHLSAGACSLMKSFASHRAASCRVQPWAHRASTTWRRFTCCWPTIQATCREDPGTRITFAWRM